MEIKLNLNLGPVQPAPEGLVKARNLQPGVGNTEFGNSAALDLALKKTPDVRPEVVARARNLVADNHYPPEEMVNKIANLMAIHINDEAR